MMEIITVADTQARILWDAAVYIAAADFEGGEK